MHAVARTDGRTTEIGAAHIHHAPTKLNRLARFSRKSLQTFQSVGPSVRPSVCLSVSRGSKSGAAWDCFSTAEPEFCSDGFRHTVGKRPSTAKTPRTPVQLTDTQNAPPFPTPPCGPLTFRHNSENKQCAKYVFTCFKFHRESYKDGKVFGKTYLVLATA